MNPQPNFEQRSLRFRVGDKWLTDEIARIEREATERLRTGISRSSVQTGALALLKLQLNGVVELSPE
jgi:hypothetical protein